ncbi:MAG: PPOX class F420-dependent oxidoreductase [Actinomycetota bacterium]|jgi:PPOX class probable F420-dependent enzyme|nr:PPOX class F420-dependent oxidoreductase [Actinomycetota bacterium]
MAPPIVPPSHRDLLDADVAVLATIGPDGRPQLSAVWFLWEDDHVRLSLHKGRQKTKNLLANPACSLLILDRAAPTRYLELRGDAEIAEDPDYEFAARAGKKYGADLREFDDGGPGRVVVTIRAVRINAVDVAAGD